jgi:diadenosine tetraphosphate (Ap4A) HIT family hydrolase
MANKKLTDAEKQVMYRDARLNGEYDSIWQSVGKCVFCDLNDKYIFHEENGVVMTVPLYAYIDGQILIVPKRHVRSVKELTTEEWETIRKFMYLAKKIIREVHGITGVQYIQKDGTTAQATVPDHIHFQVMPFDAPDLSVWNYRKLKNTPLENARLYKDRADKLQKLSKRFVEKYGDGDER